MSLASAEHHLFFGTKTKRMRKIEELRINMENNIPNVICMDVKIGNRLFQDYVDYLEIRGRNETANIMFVEGGMHTKFVKIHFESYFGQPIFYEVHAWTN